jgi:hypothetical protein
MTAHELSTYTVRLGAGLGVIEETKVLLDLWEEGMHGGDLVTLAVRSGLFPAMSARRVRNLVIECFAPRYLSNNAIPASLLKALSPHVSQREVEQLMFVYTCHANPILADFVRQVYWPAYASSRATLSNDDARQFVISANQRGKTTTPWSERTIRNVAGYLTGCCADFGLLDQGRRIVRRILPYELQQRVAILLAYELHFSGFGDNQVLTHEDWALFGLAPGDVLAELKRMALKGFVIVQTAGSAIKVHWPYATLGEVLDGIAQGHI